MAHFDITAQVPSSRVPRPEDVGLSEAEIKTRDAHRLVGMAAQRQRKPRQWQCLPSDPRVLQLLQMPHAPNGMPLPPPPFVEPVPPAPDARDEDWAAFNGRREKLVQAWQEADKRHMEIWTWWLSALDQGQRNQLTADSRWGGENTPLWECEHEDDPEYSPVQLRAPDALTAMDRYRELQGIIPFDDQDGRRHITPVRVSRLDAPPDAPLVVGITAEPPASGWSKKGGA
jgi:hypothetical protein